MLKSLDNIAQALLPIRIRILLPHLPHHTQHRQKRRPLKQHHLLRARLLHQLPQIRLHNIQIRHQRMHDPAPRPIQTLIPNARPKTPHPALEALAPSQDRGGAVGDDFFAEVGLHEVHFVDEAEDVGGGGVGGQGGEGGGVGC